MPDRDDRWQTLRWEGQLDGCLVLLDQTRLPLELVERRCTAAEHVWEAIQCLAVRGAPAIGIAAAYGVVLGLRHGATIDAADALPSQLDQVVDYLGSSRPTAVNLFWALERMRQRARALLDESRAPSEVLAALLQEARRSTTRIVPCATPSADTAPHC